MTTAPQALSPDVEALACAGVGGVSASVVALAGAWTWTGSERWSASTGVDTPWATWEGCWRGSSPACVNQGIWHTLSMGILRDGMSRQTCPHDILTWRLAQRRPA